MPTRREFLRDLSGATAGIVFAGCCCADSAVGFAPRRRQSAGAPAAGSKHREVALNGHRVAVVDVHSHVRVPEAWELVKDRIAREGRFGDMAQANPDSLGNILNVNKRLADLDEMGIDVQAVSINPFWYWAEENPRGKVIQIQNEKIAALGAAHPDRFVGLGSVALQHPSLAVE